ncbi:MAG: Crp/Fnr family transcriptional regulator [Flavicella sp.]
MNTQPLLDYIRTYIDLNAEEEALLLSKITTRNYLKNQFIVQQGDVCKHINFILSGCARTFHVDASGHEHVVFFSVENWWTSDLCSFLGKSPADFNIQCVEPTQLVQFEKETLEQLYNEIPKLERLFRKITERGFVASQKRIVRNFSLDAKARYVIFKNTYPQIEQRVPQYMIASYLGISKEFLSKIKKQLLHGEE